MTSTFEELNNKKLISHHSSFIESSIQYEVVMGSVAYGVSNNMSDNEVEQILTEHDLDLERNREQLKAIRRGDWDIGMMNDYFSSKERELESLYTASTLPEKPDEEKVKELLLNCLEHHYGSLEACIVREDAAVRALREIDAVLHRVKGIIR